MIDIKKRVTISMLTALAIVISILESYIPFFVPGVKLGLSNVVILFVIYIYSYKTTITVSITKILVVSILRTGLFSLSFFFSVSGSILSLSIMFLLHKFTKLSIIGISVVGAIFHSIGQILMSIILFKSASFLYLLPILIICSVITGIVVGLVSNKVIAYYKDNLVTNHI